MRRRYNITKEARLRDQLSKAVFNGTGRVCATKEAIGICLPFDCGSLPLIFDKDQRYHKSIEFAVLAIIWKFMVSRLKNEFICHIMKFQRFQFINICIA